MFIVLEDRKEECPFFSRNYKKKNKKKRKERRGETLYLVSISHAFVLCTVTIFTPTFAVTAMWFPACVGNTFHTVSGLYPYVLSRYAFFSGGRAEPQSNLASSLYSRFLSLRRSTMDRSKRNSFETRPLPQLHTPSLYTRRTGGGFAYIPFHFIGGFMRSARRVGRAKIKRELFS